MASVKWTDDALDNLKELDSLVKERVLAKVTWLEKNFAGTVSEPLHRELKGTCKLRVGDYRVAYEVRDQELVIVVIHVARRSESTYRNL